MLTKEPIAIFMAVLDLNFVGLYAIRTCATNENDDLNWFKSAQQTVPGDPAQGRRKPQSPAFSAKFEKCELFRSGPVGCRAISPPSPRHTLMP